MFSFLRRDSRKCPTEKEVDGGFVIIGETVEEQRRKMQTMNISHHCTNVTVKPSKSPDTSVGLAAVDAASALPDLLGDVPFTLAPHVLAVQAAFPLLPDVLLTRDINYNLASFHYDFTLENSVLHNV